MLELRALRSCGGGSSADCVAREPCDAPAGVVDARGDSESGGWRGVGSETVESIEPVREVRPIAAGRNEVRLCDRSQYPRVRVAVVVAVIDALGESRGIGCRRGAG